MGWGNQDSQLPERETRTDIYYLTLRRLDIDLLFLCHRRDYGKSKALFLSSGLYSFRLTEEPSTVLKIIPLMLRGGGKEVHKKKGESC